MSFLVDKSALARWRHPAVAARLEPLLEAGELATCGVVELEVLYSARSAVHHAEIRRDRALAYGWAPIDDETFRRAIEVQGLLAQRGRHRLPIADLLVAAAAEQAGLGVLHYDADFDRIAEVTGQRAEWVAPRGSVP